jgi:Uma2 family endonuclease
MTKHPAAPRTWTYEDFAQLPDDGNRYEVLDGEVIVTPSPSNLHQRVLANLLVELCLYVERYGLGVVLPGVDLLFVEGQFLCPDMLFVPRSQVEGMAVYGVETKPSLVVEILSPSTRSYDRVKKPRRYADFGVPEYWVVDPIEKVVWVYPFAAGTRDPGRVSDRLLWLPQTDVPPLELEMERLFRPM